MSDERPIGLFDSGVGGLTVWQAVRALLPQEQLVYFGDTLHVPYGRRPYAEIRRFSHGIVRFLTEELDAKLVVVACNTASAASLPSLRSSFRVPIVGMEPALRPATERTTQRRVGVIATAATIQGELFTRLVERFARGVEVITQACEGLVEIVEEGRLEDESSLLLLRRYLEPMLAAGIDELVLGCTHYSFLMPAIRHIVGSQVEVIEPASAVARQIHRVLQTEDIEASPQGVGVSRFFCSGDPGLFDEMLRRLVGRGADVQSVRWHSDDHVGVVSG